jgi:hypothetical protein
MKLKYFIIHKLILWIVKEDQIDFLVCFQYYCKKSNSFSIHNEIMKKLMKHNITILYKISFQEK